VAESQKSFYTTQNFRCDSKFNGIFEGYDVGAPGEFRTIEINSCFQYDRETISMQVDGLLPGCNATFFNRYIVGYKQIWFTGIGEPECFNISGRGLITSEDNSTISIQYDYRPDPSSDDRISKTFIATRK